MNLKNPDARLYGTYLKESPEEREALLRKISLIRSLREVLHDAKYCEVATPILCNVRESAPIPQFATAHPLTGQHYYLKHSAEDHLRRLAITLDRVFDLGKAIRAEREDAHRAVEFLMLQTAVRDVSLSDGVAFLIELIQTAIQGAYGTLQTKGVDWSRIHLRPLDEAIAVALEADGVTLHDKEMGLQASRWLSLHGHRVGTSEWEVMEDFVRYAVESVITEPTVLIGFPHALRHNSRVDAKTGRAQRFSLVAGGVEVCDGGLKLRDSADYRPMVDRNIELRADLYGIDGDPGPLDFYADIDTDPADVFTFGLGIERLLALSDDRNLHEVLTFPFH